MMMKKYRAECEKVFNLFDEDKDGKITLSQLQDCVAFMGGELSGEEAEMVARPLVCGGNVDGLMGLDEFVGLVESENEEEKMKDLRKAFGMYRMEGEDCITPRSLNKMLGRLGESCWSLDECVVMINHFDLNGDGVLNFQEFQVMM